MTLRALLGFDRHPLHDERAAAEQVALLNPKDPERSLRQVADWLQSVTEAPDFKPPRRLAVIELLEQEGGRLERIVLPKFTHDPRLRNPVGGQAWAAVRAWRAALAEAYARCAREQPALAARALRSRVAHFHIAMLHYEPIPAEAWRSLYAIYAAAERAGGAKAPVRAYGRDNVLTTPLLELMKGLLVAIAAPERLPPGEVHAAYRLAGRFAAAGRLEAAPFEGATHALDLAQGAAPSRIGERGAPHGGGVRYLGAGQALARLDHLIGFQEASMLDEEERLAAEYSPGQKVTVLRQFMSYWSAHAPRPERTLVRLDGPLSVVHGFRNVCGYLPHVATLAGRLDVKDDFELDPPEAWPERDAGLHVVHAHAGRLEGEWAEVGDLAAIRVHDRSDWWLAVIRRLAPAAGGLDAELEILTRKPAAVWLRVLGRSDRSAANWESASGSFAFEYTEAIVVPEPAGGHPVPSLVLPKGRFVPEQLVELLHGEHSRLLRFVDFLEQGADYDRCSFAWEAAARQPRKV